MPRSYEEKYEQDLEYGTLLGNRLNDLKHEIKVQLPCEVVGVNQSNNQVSVKILDYDFDELGNIQPYSIIPNVPIRQPVYSGSAYVILPVRIGDIGTIEFFDTNVDDIIVSGIPAYDDLEDWHSLNNGLFTNGFLPNNKIIPIDSTAKIVMATHNNIFTFTVDANDNLIVTTPTMTLNGNLVVKGDITHEGDMTSTGTITASTDVVGGGKSVKGHTHTSAQAGSPTSAPN